MTERMRSFLWLAGQMLLPLLVYELAGGGMLAWGRGLGEAWQLPLTALAAGLAALPLTAVYLKEKKAGLRTAAAAGVGLPALAGIGACLCLNHLLMLLPLPEGGYGEASRVLYRPPVPVQLLCTGLLIPFTEELVFRGYGFWALRRRFSFSAASLISAAYFGLFHGNLLQGIYAFLVGLLLAAVWELRPGLRFVWAFHGAANVTAVLLTAAGLDRYVQSFTAMMVLAALLGGAIAASSFYKMREEKKK